jgi:hypothetical protein
MTWEPIRRTVDARAIRRQLPVRTGTVAEGVVSGNYLLSEAYGTNRDGCRGSRILEKHFSYLL